MEVGLFPNPFRPGVGVRPRREAQRPLLPQHARHCPVLEAGSTTGFLVHPPLAEKETFQIGYEGEGRYQFVYSVNTKGKRWEPLITVTYLLPMGGIGACGLVPPTSSDCGSGTPLRLKSSASLTSVLRV